MLFGLATHSAFMLGTKDCVKSQTNVLLGGYRKCGVLIFIYELWNVKKRMIEALQASVQCTMHTVTEVTIDGQSKSSTIQITMN